METGLGDVFVGRVNSNARNEVRGKALCPVVIIVHPLGYAGIFPRKRDGRGCTRPSKQFQFLFHALNDFMLSCRSVRRRVPVFQSFYNRNYR